MKIFILIGLCFLVTACGDGTNYSRGYVISQSHVSPEETLEDCD